MASVQMGRMALLRVAASVASENAQRLVLRALSACQQRLATDPRSPSSPVTPRTPAQQQQLQQQSQTSSAQQSPRSLSERSLSALVQQLQAESPSPRSAGGGTQQPSPQAQQLQQHVAVSESSLAPLNSVTPPMSRALSQQRSTDTSTAVATTTSTPEGTVSHASCHWLLCIVDLLIGL